MMDLIKELLAERTRFLLTVLAIIWGTVSIACMLAIGEGLRHHFIATLSASGKNVIVLQGGQIGQSSRGVGINETVNLTAHDLNSLRQNFPTLTFLPEYTFEAEVNTPINQSKVYVSAVTADYGAMRNIMVEKNGRFINSLDLTEHRHMIVLGSQIAADLFPKTNPVGQKLQLNNIEFLVVGVTKSKMQVWSYQELDDYLVWIPQTTFQALTPDIMIRSILFVLDDYKQNSKIKQQIERIIAHNHGVSGNVTGIVEWRDSEQLQEMTAKFFFGMQVFLGIIGSLTLVVAGVGIANVMLVAVRRKTREIGIRMALGARTYQVLWHYIFGALLSTGVGGAVGLLISYAIVAALNQIHLPAEVEQFLGHIHPELSLSVVFLVISVLGVIGFLAGFFPARVAAMINPAEALRHE